MTLWHISTQTPFKTGFKAVSGLRSKSEHPFPLVYPVRNNAPLEFLTGFTQFGKSPNPKQNNFSCCKPHVHFSGLLCGPYITFFRPSGDAPFMPVHRTGFLGAILVNSRISQLIFT
jgi:hypothetical protein